VSSPWLFDRELQSETDLFKKLRNRHSTVDGLDMKPCHVVRFELLLLVVVSLLSAISRQASCALVIRLNNNNNNNNRLP